MKKTIKLLSLVLTVTFMMGLTACGGENPKDTTVGNVNDNVTNSKGESESQGETESGPELTDYFQVAIGGKVCSVLSRVDEVFTDSSAFTTDMDINGSRKGDWTKLQMYDPEKKICIGTAYTSYPSDEMRVIGEEIVYWFELDGEAARANGISITIYGGITLDSTYEEVVNVWGEPAGSGGDEQSMAYRWDDFCPKADENCTSELSVYFEDGKIDKIYLQHKTVGLSAH